ncbi:hypothetical protein [Burkholderia sp. Leaf177]|uniref:hypothetical protein n=1 Tax=Burkholderia sp. Leaf177 TaxID=1736287 RepID=UPI000AE8C554|nr:hypothetical protein [Burkholderia sp. Leaf177]
MSEKSDNKTKYVFAIIGSRTVRGRRVTRVSTEAAYKRMVLTTVPEAGNFHA